MYDDDRPGMMRVHIAQRRGDALCEAYTRDQLRGMAWGCGMPCPSLKRDIAYRLAYMGFVAPGYDKSGER